MKSITYKKDKEGWICTSDHKGVVGQGLTKSMAKADYQYQIKLLKKEGLIK